MAEVEVFAPDLMDRSKITAALPGCAVVARVADLGQAPVVIVDLSRPGVVDAIARLVADGRRVIGFGSHVDRATLDAARQAGAEVMVRSAFFSQVAAVVG
ncbi:MAG: hypothetical protein NVS1B12_13730 [Acidimicrobiales bacterium]